jgi:small neutral amino acid transporter SnatA (MarC family)
MEDVIKILPNTFIPLFVAINVFLLLPIFISMTEELSRAKKRAVVRESILTAVSVRNGENLLVRWAWCLSECL